MFQNSSKRNFKISRMVSEGDDLSWDISCIIVMQILNNMHTCSGHEKRIKVNPQTSPESEAFYRLYTSVYSGIPYTPRKSATIICSITFTLIHNEIREVIGACF